MLGICLSLDLGEPLRAFRVGLSEALTIDEGVLGDEIENFLFGLPVSLV